MSDTSGAGAGGQAPQGTTPPAPPAPTNTPPANTGSTFTQDQLNSIVKQERERERARFEGWISKDDHEAALKKASEETEGRVKGEALYELAQSEAKRIGDKLRFHDSAEALRVLDREKLPVKDGRIDGDSLETAIKKLAEEKPYLVQADDGGKPKPKPGTRPKPPSGDAGGNGSDDGKPRNAAEAMRALGRARNRR